MIRRPFFGGARKKSNARLTGQSAVSQAFILARSSEKRKKKRTPDRRLVFLSTCARGEGLERESARQEEITRRDWDERG